MNARGGVVTTFDGEIMHEWTVTNRFRTRVIECPRRFTKSRWVCATDINKGVGWRGLSQSIPYRHRSDAEKAAAQFMGGAS